MRTQALLLPLGLTSHLWSVGFYMSDKWHLKCQPLKDVLLH